MLEDKEVTFAGYKMPHPLEYRMLIKVQTKGRKTPQSVMDDTLTDLTEELEDIKEKFDVSMLLAIQMFLLLSIGALTNPALNLDMRSWSCKGTIWPRQIELCGREVQSLEGRGRKVSEPVSSTLLSVPAVSAAAPGRVSCACPSSARSMLSADRVHCCSLYLSQYQICNPCLDGNMQIS